MAGSAFKDRNNVRETEQTQVLHSQVAYSRYDLHRPQRQHVATASPIRFAGAGMDTGKPEDCHGGSCPPPPVAGKSWLSRIFQAAKRLVLRLMTMFSDSSKTKSSGIQLIAVESPQAMGLKAADLVAEQLRRKPDSILVFPTGKTPQPLYSRLKAMTASGQVDWRQSRLFHLDEYLNPNPEEPPAYKTFAQEIDSQLWKAIPEANKHYFKDYADPAAYEHALMGPEGSGPDIVILGIGPNGHIAFNEPGSAGDSPSRQIDLAEATIKANFGELNKPGMPTQAVTLGLQAILSAKTIVLLATKGKEKILRRALDPATPPTPDIPASWLKRHPNVVVITDFRL